VLVVEVDETGSRPVIFEARNNVCPLQVSRFTLLFLNGPGSASMPSRSARDVSWYGYCGVSITFEAFS
jgi:hypothetical protein